MVPLPVGGWRMTVPYRILNICIVGRIRIAKLSETGISGAMVGGQTAVPKKLGIGEFPRRRIAPHFVVRQTGKWQFNCADSRLKQKK